MAICTEKSLDIVLSGTQPQDLMQSVAGLRVLVVEDEDLVAREIRRVLAGAGSANVRLAASLAQAESLAGTDDLDAVLLDIKLGVDDVYPLAERLDPRGMPVVFVTGYATEVGRPHLDHRPVIQKPFQYRRLVATLQQAIANRTGQ